MNRIFELKDAPKQEVKTNEPVEKIKVDPKMNYSDVDVLVQERLKKIEQEKKEARKRRKQEKFLESHPGIAQIKDKIGIKIALKSDVKEKQQKEEAKKKTAEELKAVTEAPVPVTETKPVVAQTKTTQPPQFNTLFEGIKSTNPTVTTGNKAIRANTGGKWLPF